MQVLGDESRTAEERLPELEELAIAHPDSPDAWAALGELRMSAGQDGLALDAFNRAVQRDANLYSSWHWIGILNKRGKRDLPAALTAFRKALNAGAPKSREMNEIAVTQAQLGEMEAALATWRLALAEDPAWGVLYANAIKACLALEDEPGARQLFELGLKAERFE
ncbi:tetratricopeptide repeat protein, partial [Candidatus Poribacteria bacterium]|nr:tetratricopeptide repeat protein [Candidatus Poribacteria bacterium]